MRLIAYIRVSSNGQLDAYGPETQREHIEAWAKSAGHKLVDTIVESVKGTTDSVDREGLTEALDRLTSPQVDGIVVGRLDRLARALTVQEAILAMIWRDGHKAYAADQGEILQDDPDDPMRTAMRQVQGVFAQLDRAMLTKRLRDGRKAKAAAGRHAVGPYRYGFQQTGEGRKKDAGPNPDEQTAVERILALRALGQSYRAIAATLDAEGIAPRKAATWSSMTVRNIALREGAST